MTDQTPPPAPPGTLAGACRTCGGQVIRASLADAAVPGSCVVLDREPCEYGNVHLCADGTAVVLADADVERVLRENGEPLYLRHVCPRRPEGEAA